MKKLAVLFPGIRYSPECPLLYFAGKECQQAGYEILPLYYSFHQNAELDKDLSLQQFVEDTKEYVKSQLSGAFAEEYQEVVFVSKSIGTVLAGYAEQEFSIEPKQFLMTPIPETLEFMEKMGKERAAAVLGTEDKNISFEELQEFCKKQGIPLSLYQGVGHRLEAADLRDTLDMIEDIMKQLRKFLNAGKTECSPK